MSVLSCTTLRGINRKSYGIDPATGELVANRHPVGVIAAQSIGEPGTQLSLDSKHRGGAIIADETAQGLNRVEELFEARAPKGQAFLADIDGTLKVFEDNDKYIVQLTGKEEQAIVLPLQGRQPAIKDGYEVAIGDVIATKDNDSNPLIATMSGKVTISPKDITITPKDRAIVRYEIPGFKQLEVADGDKVKAGDRITSGSINLHDLMRLKGVEATQRYIMNEISKIFATQGQNIADKHLEIVVKQMFSRVIIDDSGDSDFVSGDAVSKAAVLESNMHLVADG